MSTAQPFQSRAVGVLTFGSCALNLASAQLTRDGRVVPLTPKAYDVLRYLVEHAGHLVTKQELLDAGWSDVFVGDAALKVCIREIRKALEDEAQKPQYIETAHRRGYRFIASVGTAPVSSPVLSAPAGTVPATRSSRRGLNTPTAATSTSRIRCSATVRPISCS